MSSRYKTAFRFLPPLAWVAVIVFFSLIPADELPETPLINIPYFDKLVHLGMYFFLAILLVNPLKTVKFPAFFFTVIFSVLLGGGLELLQLYCTKNRTGDWYDLLADVLGTVAGLLIYRYFIDRKMTLTQNIF
jgi:VanZ family protein